MKAICAFFLFLSWSVLAGTVEDAIKLVKAGLSEEVVVAWAETQTATLNSSDIVKLHEGKVPDKAIMALLKNKVNEKPVEIRIARKEVQPIERIVTIEEPAPRIIYSANSVYYSSPIIYTNYPYYRPYPSYYRYPSFGVSVGFNFGHGHRR